MRCLFLKPFLIILIILLVVLFTVGLPLVLDNCIIGNSFPSNVSNSEWISFFGSYYGAILGGILSLLGIVYTIRFTREQNRTDRELQIRPYFDIRYRDMSIPVHSDTWLGYAQLTVEDGENTECQSNNTGAGLLYLKNVGNGPATNFDCEIVLEDGGITYKGDFHTNNALVNTNSIPQSFYHSLRHLLWRRSGRLILFPVLCDSASKRKTDLPRCTWIGACRPPGLLSQLFFPALFQILTGQISSLFLSWQWIPEAVREIRYIPLSFQHLHQLFLY